MDYLTRLFLELEETEQTHAALPNVNAAFRRKPAHRPGQPAKDGSHRALPEEAAEISPVRQLSRLLETAQKAQTFPAPAGFSVRREQGAAELSSGGAAAELPVWQSFSPERGETLTPEAFSRFFERDARRY